MILVSILGEFHSSVFPVFYEFHRRITTHIIVHDGGFRRRRNDRMIVESLEKFSRKYDLAIKTYEYTIDEDSLVSIDKLATKILGMCEKKEEIFINATDGLSNIGILLADKTLRRGVHFIAYDMHENSYNLITKNSMRHVQMHSSLGVVDHLLLKGFEVEHVEDKAFALRHKKSIVALFEEHLEEFNKMKIDLFNHKMRPQKYPNAYKVIKRLRLDIIQHYKEITGGLFEFYVYFLLNDLGFDDIEVGVRLKQPFGENGFVGNEFDILAMHQNHLHIIECKFTKNVKLSELVYKYAALVNQLDDEGKVLLLTDKKNYKPNLVKDKSGDLEHHKRAGLSRIMIRGSLFKHKEEFAREVQAFFRLQS